MAFEQCPKPFLSIYSSLGQVAQLFLFVEHEKRIWHPEHGAPLIDR